MNLNVLGSTSQGISKSFVEEVLLQTAFIRNTEYSYNTC